MRVDQPYSTLEPFSSFIHDKNFLTPEKNHSPMYLRNEGYLNIACFEGVSKDFILSTIPEKRDALSSQGRTSITG